MEIDDEIEKMEGFAKFEDLESSEIWLKCEVRASEEGGFEVRRGGRWE